MGYLTSTFFTTSGISGSVRSLFLMNLQRANEDIIRLLLYNVDVDGSLTAAPSSRPRCLADRVQGDRRRRTTPRPIPLRRRTRTLPRTPGSTRTQPLRRVCPAHCASPSPCRLRLRLPRTRTRKSGWLPSERPQRPWMWTFPRPFSKEYEGRIIVQAATTYAVGICHFRSVMPCFIPLVFVALLLTSRSCSLNAR
jgi:hypothetical protein